MKEANLLLMALLTNLKSAIELALSERSTNDDDAVGVNEVIDSILSDARLNGYSAGKLTRNHESQIQIIIEGDVNLDINTPDGYDEEECDDTCLERYQDGFLDGYSLGFERGQGKSNSH